MYIQAISLIGSRPSTPPRSTKAPKSVMRFTVPSTTCPSSSVVKSDSFRRCRSSSLGRRWGGMAPALGAAHVEDLRGQSLPDEPLEAAPLGLAEVYVRPRHEAAHAQVDDEAALHL